MEQEREYLFDNLKGILIFLVVFAHFLQIDLRDTDLVYQWIWVIIYSFHMPVFLFVSGYFSAGQKSNTGRGTQKLAIYYILGWFMVPLIQWYVSGTLEWNNLFSPPYAMWYLLCLFLMKLLLPWLSGIRGIGIISVATALLVGFSPRIGSFLALSRLFSFLPFFILGAVYIKREQIILLRKSSGWVKGLIAFTWIFSLLLFCYIMVKSNMNYDIVWAKCSYEDGGMTDLFGLLARASFFLTAFLWGIMLLVFLPGRKCFLSLWGRSSLAVYLLHVIVFYFLKDYLTRNPITDYSIPTKLLMLIGVVLVTVIVLSLPFWDWAIRLLVNGILRITWKGTKS